MAKKAMRDEKSTAVDKQRRKGEILLTTTEVNRKTRQSVLLRHLSAPLRARAQYKLAEKALNESRLNWEKQGGTTEELRV